MASIARNRAIDVVRKRSETSIEEEPSAMEVAADSPDPLARREMTEELKRLLECVGRLEPDRQKLVLLAYYNGWSREQLAAKFDTPVNTVKTWLRRSMMDIRECSWIWRLGLMMAYSEDHIALAAEYALGTLDADERAQVETMMAVDKEFAAIVQALGVSARRAEPDGRLGRAAADGVGQHPRAIGHGRPQAPLVLPEAPPPLVPRRQRARAPSGNDAPQRLQRIAAGRRASNVVQLSSRVAALAQRREAMRRSPRRCW